MFPDAGNSIFVNPPEGSRLRIVPPNRLRCPNATPSPDFDFSPAPDLPPFMKKQSILTRFRYLWPVMAMLGVSLPVLAVDIAATLVRSAGSSHNGCAVDPSTGRFYERIGYNGESSVRVFANAAAFESNSVLTTITLGGGGFYGTYFTVLNGKLFGRKDSNSTAVTRWDVATGARETELAAVPGMAGGNSGFNWGGYSAVNGMRDGTTLYLLDRKSVPGTNWQANVLNPDMTLGSEVTFPVSNAGWGMIINGYFFFADSYGGGNITTKITLATGATEAVSIQVTGLGGYTTNAMYDEATDTVYIMDYNSASLRKITGAGVKFDATGTATNAATSVTATSATLNGKVFPNGLLTNASFRYGTDPTLATGTDSAPQDLGSGTSSVNVAQPIGSLVANTTYYFRITSTNGDGTKTGIIRSFTTGPEIVVEQPAGTNLSYGSATLAFGTSNEVGVNSPAKTVTIRNNGSLDLTGLVITKVGTHQGDFTVSSLGNTTVVAGGSTTFTVTFTPGAIGARTAAIHIASNDSDENPFVINLTGTGSAFAPGYKWSGNVAGVNYQNYYYDYTWGSEFTALESAQLTHLGVYDHNQDGLASSTQVKLWDANTQQELASTTVSSGTTDPLVGSSRYHVLTTPVTLEAGKRYVVGAYYRAQYNAGVSPEPYGSSTAITTDSRVAYYGSAYYTPTYYYQYYDSWYGWTGYYTGYGFYFPSNRGSGSSSSANYLGANFLLQAPVPVNAAPVASSATYSRAAGTSLKIDIAALLAASTSDPDGDPRTLESVGTSAQGAGVSVASGRIFYSPANSNSDSFSYTVSDGQGHTATGTINVMVVNPAGASVNFALNGLNQPTMQFAGIPGYRYTIQRSQNLSEWADIQAFNAPPNGVFSFTDANPPPGSAYYRMSYTPAP